MHRSLVRLTLLLAASALVAAGCNGGNGAGTATTATSTVPEDNRPPATEQIADAEEQLEENPRNAAALMRLCLGHIRLSEPDPETGKLDDDAQEHLDSAVDACERLVEADDDNDFGQQLLGDLYQRSGQYEKAVPIFRQLAADNEDNPAYLIAWATAAENAGNRQEALRAYRLVVKRFPKDPVAGAARQQIEQLQRDDEGDTATTKG